MALPPFHGHRVMRPCEGPRSGLSIAFEADGADLSKGCVPAGPVVSAFDPRPTLDLRPFLGRPDASVVELGLQHGEE